MTERSRDVLTVRRQKRPSLENFTEIFLLSLYFQLLRLKEEKRQLTSHYRLRQGGCDFTCVLSYSGRFVSGITQKLQR